MTKTAVLVDGGFYRKRAKHFWGDKTPQKRAEELNDYVFRHLGKHDGPCQRELYRIFYYDCPPLAKTVYHPLRGNIDFRRVPEYQWALDFYDELKKRRKVALRMGRLSDVKTHYNLTPEAVKKLCAKRITVDELTDLDFLISAKQKGVDMRMGVDMSSLAYEGIVNQIILIAGDSDFVPAAKAARRKGIDFILDPMGNNVADDLFEHIDGLESFVHSGDPTRVKEEKRARRKAEVQQKAQAQQEEEQGPEEESTS